eukprot:Blabericola_migrator_1__6349@NODE_31_length_18777_cov_137_037787_g27_i0_p2_GENE_NODE_31_length_18777_cov_137_037787_g27_i0NODE_31_length_18777_cov_137_037787_g27_i0_p2_ORF_typecomplete_len1323_score243_90Coatomer_WDAD/PF04053_14/40Coatomer_WDAD/PF04053_14/1_4e02Coatomer_WDAD/PF04053_14/2_9e85COPI_C/PF06957_11/2_3e54WD40/PF00400_32/5_7WD40/PF00400_32/7_3e07WD40/PF00400_32/1_3e09WD40/PF00400_32/3_2e10WD40/PF00400_32/3_7e08WD40/PF00400_32/1_1e09WD40/PF00400_32/3_9e03WD40/PF00400_32/4_4e02ANAPC4_WD4
MLVKCETKSQRVKGLAFHPRLSWILASLHNGVIQLWDYRLGCLIERFEEHFGPVRGVDFHVTQPLFVSGGDDHKVKVWNYKNKKSLFTLTGHLDYIRTVQFHREYPWICSAGDDQTVRIWNWQSRHCLAVLAGHHHYVMCATFHPKDDLLASASLDQTIRIWDVSGLREKTLSGTRPGGGLATHSALSASTEMFGATDAFCKFILDGHDRGVNWVSFHPNTNMIASGADDRLIKLWRYDESKWWEVDTLRGHFNNVSCVVFHPLKDIVVSNSEDRTIRVWDLSRRVLLHTYRRDNDRFWMLSAQTDSNLLAVGHDTGMVVFKLERERPASCAWIHDNKIRALYVKGSTLKFTYDCIKGARAAQSSEQKSYDQKITCDLDMGNILVRKPLDALSGAAYSLARNPLNTTEVDLAILYRNVSTGVSDAKWSYDLHSLAVNLNSVGAQNVNPVGGLNLGPTRTESGTCNAFAFCARNRFVTLDNAGNLYIQNISRAGGELRKKVELPSQMVVDNLFFAGNNKVLLRCEETLVLFDVLNRKVLGELNSALIHSPGENSKVRQAIWSPTQQYVALLSKHHVLIASASMEHLATAHECIRVKSGVWDENGGFVYNTISHLKYILPNGDKGIFQSIPESGGGMYLLAALRGYVVYLTRRSEAEKLKVNNTEEALKIALSNNKLEVVASLLQQNPMRGNAWVGYLKKKGYNEVAYHCVSDPAAKALLATEAGDLEAAQEAVQALNNPVGWRRLGGVALKLGNVSVAEKAFQKSRNYERLIHLYSITGNDAKLNKLAELIKSLGDYATPFHISLLTGNLDLRIDLLLLQKQYTLAYVIAVRHNLLEKLEGILKHMAPEVITSLDQYIARLPPGQCLLAPLSVAAEDKHDWPLLPSSELPYNTSLKGGFDSLMTSVRENKVATNTAKTMDLSFEEQEPAVVGGFLEPDSDEDAPLDTKAWGNEDEEDWFGPDDTDAAAQTSDTLPMGTPSRVDVKAADPGLDEVIVKGIPILKRALEGRIEPSIADYVAAGHFRTAFGLLDKRIALRNAKLLVPMYTAAFQASQSLIPTLPLMKNISLPLLDGSDNMLTPNPTLHHLVTAQYLSVIVKEGTTSFGARKLSESKEQWKKLLYAITLASTSTEAEEHQIADMKKLARDYLVVINLENKKQEVVANGAADDVEVKMKELKLAILQSSCDLHTTHKFLLLKEASKLAIKSGNFVTGAAIARKVIQGDFAVKNKALAPEVEKIKRIVAQCEAKGTNSMNLKIDGLTSSDKLRFCMTTLELMEPEEDDLICNYCEAVHRVGNTGSPCAVCEISELGAQVGALRTKPRQL